MPSVGLIIPAFDTNAARTRIGPKSYGRAVQLFTSLTIQRQETRSPSLSGVSETAGRKGETSSETGDDCPVAAARSILRRGLPQFASFELLFRLLGLAVFIPSTAWLTSRLIAWSGSGAVSNYDLAGFFLSFKGFCYLIVVVTIGFALAFFEFGGLTALAISLQRRERIRMRQLFGFLGLALRASLAAFGTTIPDLPGHRTAIPRSRRRSILDASSQKTTSTITSMRSRRRSGLPCRFASSPASDSPSSRSGVLSAGFTRSRCCSLRTHRPLPRCGRVPGS